MDEIYRKMTEILREVLEIEPEIEKLTTKSSLSDLGINSVDFIKLLVKIEMEFGIEIEDENLSEDLYETIDDLLNFVECKIRQLH